MRIYNVLQGSEQWEALRMRPTASQFGRIITPKRGQVSAQIGGYACEIVAKHLGVYVEPPPSFWMEWGLEHEPLAVAAYEEQTSRVTHSVGFVVPDWTEDFGGSPDRLVDPDGLLEVKCPKPETLISYHAAGELPEDYIGQVQGLLWITGRAWCDFYAWHPQLTPFLLRVLPDPDYHEKLAVGLAACIEEINRIASLVQSHPEVMETWTE